MFLFRKVDEKVKLVRSGGVRSVCGGGEALSEALEELVDRYFEEKCYNNGPEEKKRKCRGRLSKEQVVSIFAAKASRCYVEPGEAVGALCAQVRPRRSFFFSLFFYLLKILKWLSFLSLLNIIFLVFMVFVVNHLWDSEIPIFSLLFFLYFRPLVNL